MTGAYNEPVRARGGGIERESSIARGHVSIALAHIAPLPASEFHNSLLDCAAVAHGPVAIAIGKDSSNATDKPIAEKPTVRAAYDIHQCYF